MILTLAGPGAGKTTDMIENIICSLHDLKANKTMAIISYTNASVNDIKDKLSEKVIIPENVFIGTIHSFLLQFIIIPYGAFYDYKVDDIIVVDRLDDTGIDWISTWVDKNKKEVTQEERNIIKQRMISKRRNCALYNSITKGIYTYDGIIKYSKEIINKKGIFKSLSNKLQFLYVDEYQDMSSYGHQIIMRINKGGNTNVFVVGDPDQSIYRFRYGESQIGEKAPILDKQPIIQLRDLPNDECEKRCLLINYRSSKEIVTFVNRYSTLENQQADKDSFCKICFITDITYENIINNMNNIIKKFNSQGKLMILAKKNDTLNLFGESIDRMTSSNANSSYIDCNKIISTVISLTGYSKVDFMNNYELSRFDLRLLAIHIRKRMMENHLFKIENNVIQEVFLSLFSRKIIFKDSEALSEDKTINYNYNNQYDFNTGNNTVECISIHKAKGLEAENVLLIAKTRKELLKWLNMNNENMLSVKDEDYRLGYVAFSRAKRILMIACLEQIDICEIDKDVFELY